MPFWHPKGMMIWRKLEDLRQRENARRGYLEVKTPLLYDAETFFISGHWEKYEDLMFKLDVDGQPWAMKAMNCPGHMLLFGSKLRSYRELPCVTPSRRRCTETSATGTLHGLLRVRTSRRTTRTSSHRRPDPGGDRRRRRLRPLPVRAVRDDGEFELSTRPENKLGSDEEWDTEGALRVALERNEIPYDRRGRRRVLRAEDRPPHGGRARTEWQMGTIQLDSQMPARFGSRTWAPTTPSTRCTSSTALLGSLRAFIGILVEHYAGAFPSGSRLSSFGSSRWARITARRPRIGREALGLPGGGRRPDETVGKRIRNAEVEKIPYTVVYGDRESEDAGSPGARRRAIDTKSRRFGERTG